MFQDKSKVCKDCRQEFIFTAGEQEFFQSRGFENEPGRCPACRAAKKKESDRGYSGGYQREERQMYQAVCHSCGAPTRVPFQPTAGKPVYCNECYQPKRRAL